MQSRQPADGPAVQVDRAGAAAISGDAWSRSAGLVIVALAIVGVLFFGALMLLYYGAVQTAGAAIEPRVQRVQPITPAVAADARDAVKAPGPAIEMPPRGDSAKAAAVAPAPRTVAEPPRERSRPTALPAPVGETPPAPTAIVAARESRTPRNVERDVPIEPRPAPAQQDAAAMPPPASQERAEPLSTAPPPSRPIELAPEQVAAVDPAPPRTPAPAVRNEPPAEPPTPVVLRPVSRRQPQFPPQALREGVTRGTVLARLTVATDGSVSAVAIVSSNPPRLFDRAAERALAEWRFEPIARPTTAQIELSFRAE